MTIHVMKMLKGCALKDAGNDRHFSSDVADFSSSSSDALDDGDDLLLQKPFVFGGLVGSSET